MKIIRLLLALALFLLGAIAGAQPRAILGAAPEPARMTWIGNSGFHVTSDSDAAALAERLRAEHLQAHQDHPHDCGEEAHIIIITVMPATQSPPAAPAFTNRRNP